MEPLKCPNHKDTLCMLKTGTKPGPQQGVSFYVCSQCKFNKSTHLEPVKCANHPEYFVELQSLHSHMSSGQLRRYYRCHGRKQGESWCGYQHFIKSETSPADKQLNAERVVESRNNEAPSASESIILISDDEEDMERSVNVQKKASAASLMEVSFADLNKSQAASSSSSSHTDVKFAEQSFKNYRESPHPSMKPKSGISLSSKQAHVSDSESSEESDLDESADARKLLKTLTLSDKDDKGTALTKTDGNNVDSVGDDKTSGLAAGHDVRRNKNEIVKPEGTAVSQSTNASKVEGKLATSDTARPKEIKGEEQGKASAKPSVGGEKKEEVDLPTESLSSLMNRKQFFTAELKKLQTSLRSIQLQKLPDGGRRMLDKVKELEQTIKDIDADISKVFTHQGGNKTAANGSQVIKVHRGPNGQTTFTVLKSGPNQNPPGFTSASQMMPRAPPPTGSDARSKTSNVTTAAVPVQQQQQPQQVFIPGLAHLPQHLQQLFAANPQAMTLYGGRMTAQRLREVGSITTEAIDKLHKQLETCPTESTECPDPEGLKVTLMPHQRQALAWLAWREQQHPPGGILADDMGLGKTLTTISHILRHKAARCEGSQDEWLSRDKQVEKLDKAVKKTRATLIIAPASLVHQWAKEIERRCRPGLLKFLVYHGPNRERSIHRLIDNDIVLTTYTIISKEVGADKTQSAEGPARDAEEEVENEIKSNEKPKDLPMLLQIGWERIVLDEAHNIKNHKSLTAMSVCRLRAVYRWALTGTPIQNDLLDMYSLLRYLRFSPFDEFKVWKRHVDSGRGDTKRLNTIVKALLLRRTKEQTCSEGKPLVSLPTKSSQTIQVELSEGERTVYEKLFRKTQSTVLEYVKRHEEKASGPLMQQSESTSDRLSHPSQTSGAVGGAAAVPGGAAVPGAGGDGAMSAVPGRSTGSQILVLLLRLRQCCSHLNLMKSHLEAESLESDGIELTLEEQMKGMLLDDITGESSSASSLSSTKIYDKSTVSTKLKCVMDKLCAIQEDGDKKRKDKSVIVSQWTHMLEIVGHHLEKAGIPHSIIQGNIPAKKRMDIVDDFNSNSRGAQVLLLSLRAGGVGLNLVGGNHLFLLDIHWNPALEEQACDRIYRMGQKKDVFIYRFLCKDTIEEKIVALQQRKLSLAKSVLSGGGAKSQKLTLTDLRLLFGV